MWVARRQAQNAADAGALAGAMALAFDDFDDRDNDRAGEARRCSVRAGQQRVGPGAGRPDATDIRSTRSIRRRSRRCARRQLHARGRLSQPGARQPAADVLRPPGRPDRPGRARDRHRAGGRRQRERLPQAVGDSRQMGSTTTSKTGSSDTDWTMDDRFETHYDRGPDTCAALPNPRSVRCGTGFTLPATSACRSR